jgi:hypothetical protein
MGQILSAGVLGFIGVLGLFILLAPILILVAVGKSLKVQTAMLEQLERLNALAANRTTEPPSGRFSHLAGE